MLDTLTGRRGEIDADRVRAAVAAVADPEIGRPLGELGMLGEVTCGRRGRVRVAVSLTTRDCPVTEQLRAAVTEAASAVDGVRGVEVVLSVMGVRQRAELAQQLKATTTPVTGALGSSTRVYAVASGKGGVGKSTVTANVAAELARSGQRVGVLDADVWGYSMPQLFGVRRSPVSFGELMLPVPAHGVSLMSVGFFVDDGQPVVWRGPMLHKAIQQFLSDTHWGELDVLLIDLPPGTGDVTLTLLELLPDAALLAVTTPQPAAHEVAGRVVRMAREAGMPIAGVVENMTAAVCRCCGQDTPVFGEGGGARLAAQAEAPLLGQVPLDAELRAAGDQGTPVVVAAPAAASAQELCRVAATLPAPRRSLAGRALPLSVV
ncbi:MAG: P-loop NTPase [Pseudonocardiaceae bacterium]|nr:P-loop NTPase [Pseudonocardiaceae bacterium]